VTCTISGSAASAGWSCRVTTKAPQRTTVSAPQAAPGLDHDYLPADLSLLEDTNRLAEATRHRTDRLDAVVLCAGVLATVPEWTPEALERTFVLNYLSRYMLARQLLPALTAAPSGRLVLVANAGRYRDTLNLDDLQYRHQRPGLAVCGRTQFANDCSPSSWPSGWPAPAFRSAASTPGWSRPTSSATPADPGGPCAPSRSSPSRSSPEDGWRGPAT
jgi:hypothetical protein